MNGARLRDFVADQGWSFLDAAKRLGVGRTHVWRLIHGRRQPSLKLATAIERLTATWEHGPIRVAEWDVEDAAGDPPAPSAPPAVAA